MGGGTEVVDGRRVNLATQRVAIWAGPLLCAFFGLGLLVVAGLVPPPEASDTADDVARLYSENPDKLRAGLVIMFLGGAFIAPWSAAIAVQLKRIEGKHAPMTYTQLASGAANVIVVSLPVMIMIAASFRPERDPEVTQALHDLAWLLFVMNFPPVLVQQLSITVAILAGGDQTIYPRWVAYFNAWAAVLLVPAVLIPFFKTGPFAWHGIFEFWLAAVDFFGWVVVMTVATLRAIHRIEG